MSPKKKKAIVITKDVKHEVEAIVELWPRKGTSRPSNVHSSSSGMSGRSPIG